jgi:hypothetical protein
VDLHGSLLVGCVAVGLGPGALAIPRRLLVRGERSSLRTVVLLGGELEPEILDLPDDLPGEGIVVDHGVE